MGHIGSNITRISTFKEFALHFEVFFFFLEDPFNNNLKSGDFCFTSIFKTNSHRGVPIGFSFGECPPGFWKQESWLF